jgi:hypothetical protein
MDADARGTELVTSPIIQSHTETRADNRLSPTWAANGPDGFGQRLMWALKDAGISTNAFCEEIAAIPGAGRSTIYRYLGEKRRTRRKGLRAPSPTAELVFAAAELVGVEPRWLLLGSGPRLPSPNGEVADASVDANRENQGLRIIDEVLDAAIPDVRFSTVSADMLIDGVIALCGIPRDRLYAADLSGEEQRAIQYASRSFVGAIETLVDGVTDSPEEIPELAFQSCIAAVLAATTALLIGAYSDASTIPSVV